MDKLFQNEDIMRYIFSFGYPQHRNYMNQVCKDINTNLKCIKDWPKNRVNHESLCDFIYRTHNDKEIIELYNIYKRCHCCTRHSSYKPNIISKQENNKTYPNHHYNDNQKHECLCNCRHITRQIYASFWYDY